MYSVELFPHTICAQTYKINKPETGEMFIDDDIEYDNRQQKQQHVVKSLKMYLQIACGITGQGGVLGDARPKFTQRGLLNFICRSETWWLRFIVLKMISIAALHD